MQIVIIGQFLGKNWPIRSILEAHIPIFIFHISNLMWPDPTIHREWLAVSDFGLASFPPLRQLRIDPLPSKTMVRWLAHLDDDHHRCRNE